jgi:hypothetical protein
MEGSMSSYSVQASSLIGQDPLIQSATQTSAPVDRQSNANDTPHVSALPQDTVTLSAAAQAQRAALGEGLATNATPNKQPPQAAHPKTSAS